MLSCGVKNSGGVFQFSPKRTPGPAFTSSHRRGRQTEPPPHHAPLSSPDLPVQLWLCVCVWRHAPSGHAPPLFFSTHARPNGHGDPPFYPDGNERYARCVYKVRCHFLYIHALFMQHCLAQLGRGNGLYLQLEPDWRLSSTFSGLPTTKSVAYGVVLAVALGASSSVPSPTKPAIRKAATPRPSRHGSTQAPRHPQPISTPRTLVSFLDLNHHQLFFLRFPAISSLPSPRPACPHILPSHALVRPHPRPAFACVAALLISTHMCIWRSCRPDGPHDAVTSLLVRRALSSERPPHKSDGSGLDADDSSRSSPRSRRA